LLYLFRTDLRNRTRVRLRRLRQPRYALGALGGLAYFASMLFRQSGPWVSWFAGQGVLIGSLALFLLTMLVWALPAPKSPLAFTQAEVQFLIAAPLTRRQLLHYKLLGLQMPACLSALVFTIVFRPASLAEAAMFAAGLWLVLDTWTMHVLGLSLARGSLLRHGRIGLARQRVPLLAAMAALAALVLTLLPAWSSLRAATNVPDLMNELKRLTSAGASGVLFWPFRALIRVPLASSAREFLLALPGAIALLALNYAWVLRADMAFEEAAAAQADRIEAMRRTGGFRPKVRKTASTPFDLATTGRLEPAIVWKNLILVGRYASFKVLGLMLLVVVPVAAGFAIAMHGEAVVLILEVLCGMALFLILLMGPQFLQSDLRQDLASLAVLKTWPIRGAELVLGEVLAPVAVMTGMAWLFIAAGAVFADLPVADRVSYGVAAALVAPGVLMSGFILQNAFALMFPAWVNPRAVHVPGLDSMGQRLILMYGGMLAAVVAVVPPAMAGGAVWLAIAYATGVQAIVVPAAVAAAAYAAECWLATRALGRLFDRMDVSAIGPAPP
jgi:ABC-2 type transport system permease protein